MANRILRSIIGQSAEQRRANAKKAVLHHLARIGGRVFGPIPHGVRREFFCLDRHTWVWHEEWTDQQGHRRAATTRYDVRPSGILKSQGVSSYQRLTHEEERNFRQAVEVYYRQISHELKQLTS